MASIKSAISTASANQFIDQLEELIISEASLSDRLFRCRQVLEEIYKNLTTHTNIAFTGLYARMQFAYETSVIPGDRNEQLQLLRLLTNKVVHHDDFDYGEDDFASAVLILAETTRFLSGNQLEASKSINDYLAKTKAKKLVSMRSVSEQTVAHIFGVASTWKTSSAGEAKKYIEITCRTSEGSQITVTLWEKEEFENQGRRWTLLDKSLWKYCNISFYNLSQVQGVANRYQSTPLTLVVLEQDFLMDVSSVADCFQGKDYYPEVFILNKLFSEPITVPLAKGKCVNYIFDELTGNPDKPLKDIFDEYLHANPHYVFVLGEKSWQTIYDQILAEHYSQLKEVAKDLYQKNCQLEPSFISLKFGLHGRLDAITMPDEKIKKYTIIELKSGSAHPYDVWKSHQMQVVGYNMILKEIFGAANIANSSIFYSKSKATPLRHVVNNIMAEQDFMMCRNRIIGMLQKLATTPEKLIYWLKSNPRNYSNDFLSQKADNVSSVLRNLSESEMKWFIQKLFFIFREVWAIKTGAFSESETNTFGFSSLWNCSLAEKQQQYRIICNLWVESVADEKIVMHRQDDVKLTNLRIGDIIVLYKQNQAINEQRLIRGKIAVLDDERIVINTRCRIKHKDLFDKYTLWSIEPDLMESSIYCGLSSIFTLLSSEKEIRDKLLGNKMPEFENISFKGEVSWRNDISLSLKGMIAAKDYYLVQGPPGTGKTSCLLMQYIGYILSETKEIVLILSFTNRAVDEFCAQLDKENFKYLRFGANNHGYEKSKTSEVAKNKNDVKKGSEYEKNRIFASTVHTFLSVAPDLLNKITINEMIIDEASQIQEHHVIGLMAKIRKTILIGDQNQLPPIVLQQTKSGKESILEKLIANADKKIFPDCYSMLTNHYRMHNDIARLVSDNYQNKLVSDSQRQVIDAPWLATENSFLNNLFSNRVVWIDTKPSFQSKADVTQASLIRKIIEKLSQNLPRGEICKKVGIISPFRAQAQCIISALGSEYKELTVDTVERYQGSERDCIIMSYPLRYNHELAMLQSINRIGTIDRKLNVALSRAREQLIIMGSVNVLTHSEFFHKVYSLVKKYGNVIPAETLIKDIS